MSRNARPASVVLGSASTISPSISANSSVPTLSETSKTPSPLIDLQLFQLHACAHQIRLLNFRAEPRGRQGPRAEG
jgi:hypothetical protein